MPPEVLARLLPDSAAIAEGRMTLAGCDLRDLAERFGTPLYLYDDLTIRDAARRAREALGPRCTVSFAAKACSLVGVLRVLAEEGLGLDVLSAGEIEAGRRAGVSPERMYLHGNFKPVADLRWAVREGAHAVVLDNVEEIERLEAVCREEGMRVRVMLRLDLPIDAGTHPAIDTSGARSKFGFLPESTELDHALARLEAHDLLRLIGLHVHLGSQISDPGVYQRAARALLALGGDLRIRRHDVEELSLGGGWAVPYRPGDRWLDAGEVARALPSVEGIRWAVEPGRAIVARAGVALYTVIAVKHREGRRLVIVDGGMGDNPRPALYGTQYTAFLPETISKPDMGVTSVVGRYCESGDVLAYDAPLPHVRSGDLLAVPVSGAYHLSMASHYNLVPPPPALLLRDGAALSLSRRATPHDLLSGQIADGCWSQATAP